MNDIMLSMLTRTALLSVQDTTAKMGWTQQRLQSGKAINSTIDDAVKYFQAKGLNDRAEQFYNVKVGMDQAISLISTTNVGLTAVHQIYKQMKGLVQAAKTADDNKLQDISLQWPGPLNQADAVATDSSYQGKSLLCPDPNPYPTGFDPATYWGINKNAGLAPTSVTTSLNGSGIQINTIPLPRADVTTSASSGGQPPGFGATTLSGGAGVTTTPYYPGDQPGTITMSYDMFNVPDQADIVLCQPDGSGSITRTPLASTNNPVSGQGTLTANYPGGTGAYIEAVMTGPNGTAWQYRLDWSVAGGGSSSSAATFAPTNFFSQRPADVDGAERWINKAISYVEAAQSYFGGHITTLQNRINFTKDMINTSNEGSDKLTLADLNEEGAALLVLQIREQIGISSISMAGQAQSNIMSLLR